MRSILLLAALSASLLGCSRAPNYRRYDNQNGIETFFWMQRVKTTDAGICAVMFGNDRPYHYAEDGRTKVPGVLWVVDYVDFDKQQLLEHQSHSRKEAEDFAEQKCPTKRGSK